MLPYFIYIPFVFALGACIGSFLNVVVYRVPRRLSIVSPPSHCPQCDTPLAWYDNIPILGWVFLRGRCRYCHKPISSRYPIIEFITASIFVFYYAMFFIVHAGPVTDFRSIPTGVWFVGQMTDLGDGDQWPIYFLDMALLAGLLAASLIDAETFEIPASIPWWLAAAGIVVHAIVDSPTTPGNVLITPAGMSLSAGAAVGLAISAGLLYMEILPLSFPNGDLLETEREELSREAEKARRDGNDEPDIPPELTYLQVCTEMGKEILFLIPPLLLGAVSLELKLHVPAIGHWWIGMAQMNWLNGALGALLGGMAGGFLVWFFRIAGSLVFGKEAMGLGDIHLMFGVGAVLGTTISFLAFFLAPVFGILVAVWLLITSSRRQIPYGPYLSLATAFVMLFYGPIAAHYRGGILGLAILIRQYLGIAGPPPPFG